MSKYPHTHGMEAPPISATILYVLKREMLAIAYGWRLDWSDFDGQSMYQQFSALNEWAEKALRGDAEPDYRMGTLFLEGKTRDAMERDPVTARWMK